MSKASATSPSTSSPAEAPRVAAPPPGESRGPGWIDPEIQGGVQWRDGDIVVSVPVKSGTTWTMNIVHQLRSGGDPDLKDVYVEVPWLELVPSPGVTREQRLAKFAAMPRGRRRAFKTHSPPGLLPYQKPGGGRKDVRYVVVARNPDEALASMHPFAHAHTRAWFDLWKLPREAFCKPSFASFYDEVARDLFPPSLFGFVAAWWPLRHAKNVLLLHFSDMKADHEGSVREIARFLGFRPTAKQWPKILEYTSFAWMKAHEDKFELRTIGPVPVLDSGAMMRKGRVGAAKDDGVTPEISADVARIGREVLKDDAAFEWFYRGGLLSRAAEPRASKARAAASRAPKPKAKTPRAASRRAASSRAARAPKRTPASRRKKRASRKA
jgi:aryl sulfotransferase